MNERKTGFGFRDRAVAICVNAILIDSVAEVLHVAQSNLDIGLSWRGC